MKSLKNESGFTFFEISIVILILAVLVAIAVPNYQGIKDEAGDLVRKADIGTLENAFSLAAVTSSSLGKDAIASGTIINVLTDIEGNIVDPNTLKLYGINTQIGSYYKKLKNSIGDYMVDSQNNVYYKGLFSNFSKGITEEDLENDIGTTVTQKTMTGDAITARYRHSAVVYNNKMIIFGGNDGANKNDCYEINLETYVSTKKTLIGSSISARGYQSAVVYNNKMIMFGGYNGSSGLGDCYEVDLETYNVTQKSLTGDTISARWGHSVVAYAGKMIIFGGYDGASRLNDCYEVDLNSYTVVQKTLTGDTISERNHHTAVVFNGKMFIFGGYNYYTGLSSGCYSVDLLTYNVTRITVTGDSISARYIHTAEVYNGKMITFGGSTLTNTCYAVNLSTNVSTQMNLVNPPSARYSHTAVMYFNKMIIFGGYDGTTMLNDCYEIE